MKHVTLLICALALFASAFAQPMLPSQLTLEWDDNSSNETGFKLERSLDEMIWLWFATTDADVETYVDMDVVVGTTYHYRVRAYNAQGDSGYSNSASGTPKPISSVPNDPSNAAVYMGSSLTGISTRMQYISGSEPVIAGFNIEGDQRRTVVIRGVGPSLAQFSVYTPLADPRIEIAGTPFNNDNWDGTPELKAAFEKVNLFAFPDDSKDSALLVEVPPGSYTVHLTSADGGSGTGLIEVYLVPLATQ